MLVRVHRGTGAGIINGRIFIGRNGNVGEITGIFRWSRWASAATAAISAVQTACRQCGD